jgi:hypothetical protein
MDMASSDLWWCKQRPYYSKLAVFSKPTAFGTVTEKCKGIYNPFFIKAQ